MASSSCEAGILPGLSLLSRAAMRSRETMARRAVALEGSGPNLFLAGEPALPPLGVVLLNRAGFGPRPGDLQAFEALGADEAARLQAWVDAFSGLTALANSLAEVETLRWGAVDGTLAGSPGRLEVDGFDAWR